MNRTRRKAAKMARRRLIKEHLFVCTFPFWRNQRFDPDYKTPDAEAMEVTFAKIYAECNPGSDPLIS